MPASGNEEKADDLFCNGCPLSVLLRWRPRPPRPGARDIPVIAAARITGHHFCELRRRPVVQLTWRPRRPYLHSDDIGCRYARRCLARHAARALPARRPGRARACGTWRSPGSRVGLPSPRSGRRGCGRPLCRFHHRCKQAQGWRLTQPQPGLLIWTAPHGRSYTVKPACTRSDLPPLPSG
jgi:hypothetical protein